MGLELRASHSPSSRTLSLVIREQATLRFALQQDPQTHGVGDLGINTV